MWFVRLIKKTRGKGKNFLLFIPLWYDISQGSLHKKAADKTSAAQVGLASYSAISSVTAMIP